MADNIKKIQTGKQALKVMKKELRKEAVIKREFILEGLGCANCAAKMERGIKNLDGISEASVNFVSKTMILEIEEISRAEELIAAAREVINKIEADVVIKDKYDKKNKMAMSLKGLCCPNCAAKIETQAKDIEGVLASAVDFASQRLVLEIDADRDKESVMDAVKRIVKRVEPDVEVQYEEGAKLSKPENSESEGIDRLELVRIGMGALIFAVATVFKFSYNMELILYITSYILVGGEVIIRAVKNISHGQVFDENFLMGIATLGAFSIGQFPEGVAVMLFYQVGEIFQDMAVDRSRKSISALMDIRPDFAYVVDENGGRKVSPEAVSVGDLILVRPGEKIPLDGVIVEGSSILDTSALTGEAMPKEVESGEEVLSGVINKNGVLKIKVTKSYGDSTVSKILDLVQNAGSRKASTENFITKFARYYTPAVVFSAVLLAVLPPLIVPGATFSQWIYRALVFLVVSCPCALVISIPLSFFGGIGGASKNGILVKGGNYLEALNNVETVVFDKTGTLTKGVFGVEEIYAAGGLKGDEILEYTAYAESLSNHPIAVSIVRAYGKPVKKDDICEYNEIAGHGVKVTVQGRQVLAGNFRLMVREGISYKEVDREGTLVHVAVDGVYAGYILISDQVKEDSADTINELRAIGVKNIVMLTGDNKKVADKIGRKLGLDKIYSELLPNQKVEKIEELEVHISSKGKLVFVGDGINDAPVLARADIGIAMGGVGSDAAIEAADVVIMTDEPSKVVAAIKVAKKTKSIVMQNIVFALGVKLVILGLGAMGIATMWEAVFGDVGVALIAVLNAMRAMKIE